MGYNLVMAERETIGERITRARKARWLTCADLAERLGIAPNAPSKVKHCDLEMSVGTVVAWAAALDVHPAWLCFGAAAGLGVCPDFELTGPVPALPPR